MQRVDVFGDLLFECKGHDLLDAGAGFGRHLRIGQQHIAGRHQHADAAARRLRRDGRQRCGAQGRDNATGRVGREVIDAVRIVCEFDE